MWLLCLTFFAAWLLPRQEPFFKFQLLSGYARPEMVARELLAFMVAHNLLRWVMTQAAREHQVDLYRISFTGAMAALRHFATAMAQAKTAKIRREIWADLLRTLADDLVPERPGRREPRAVKKRPKPHPRLNKPRRQFREDGQLSHCNERE